MSGDQMIDLRSQIKFLRKRGLPYLLITFFFGNYAAIKNFERKSKIEATLQAQGAESARAVESCVPA